MGEHGRGRGERGGGGGGGGGASTTTAPNPPPPSSEAQTPPTRPQETKVFFRVVRRNRRRGDPPAQKAQTPHPHHHRTAYESRPRPQTHQPPQDRHRTPPLPSKTNTPKGAEKKDNRPGDPIVGMVVHVPYPNGVERGTVRGTQGRKYGAAWVEYPGGTTLYEVSRSLLFPTLEEAERHREEARAAGKKKAKSPTPTNEASNPPNANLATEPTNSTNPTNPTNPPSGPAKMWDPTTGSHEV